MTRIARCCCGSLRAEATDEPSLVGVCHCMECQRRTGSAFGVSIYFPKDQVRAEGPSKIYVRGSDSGRKLEFHFCPDCGTTVFWYAEFLPDHIGIAFGAFTDDWPALGQHEPIDPLPWPTTIGQPLAASPRQFWGWPNRHEGSKKGGALGNQPRRPAIVANRRARPSYDLSSSTGDNVWASRARSQRPSECLRYTVIRWPACCVASPPARGVTDNASRLRV